MTEQTVNYVEMRAQTREELFGPPLTAETLEIPTGTELTSVDQTLELNIGEVGLAGYHLQRGFRTGRLPKILRPVIENAEEVVLKTLERHNKAACDTKRAPGEAIFAILRGEDLVSVAGITARVVGRWARALWSKDKEQLLPDRRAYSYRDGPTEKEVAIEIHAKSVILETAAAVMEVRGMTKQSEASSWNKNIESVVVDRGPDFLRHWMSREILHSWLDKTGRTGETEAWDAFAQKSVLLDTLRSNIYDPISELARRKAATDLLDEGAVANRTGWSLERITEEMPLRMRKKIAATYSKDPWAGVDRVAERLDQATPARIQEYTGWSDETVKIVFQKVEIYKIVVELKAPVRDLVLAISETYDFLQDTSGVATLLGWTTEKVKGFFTDSRQKKIAGKARPIARKDERDGTVSYVVSPETPALLTREAARRFDLLHSQAVLPTLVGPQLMDGITEQTITNVTVRTRDFDQIIARLRRGISLLSDARMASEFGITQADAKRLVPWTVRQAYIINNPRDPLKAVREWWSGDRDF